MFHIFGRVSCVYYNSLVIHIVLHTKCDARKYFLNLYPNAYQMHVHCLFFTDHKNNVFVCLDLCFDSQIDSGDLKHFCISCME